MKSLTICFFAVGGMLLIASCFAPNNFMSLFIGLLSILMMIVGCIMVLFNRSNKNNRDKLIT